MWVNTHVARFTGESVCTSPHGSIDRYSPTNSRSECHENNVIDATRNADSHFGQECTCRIVVDSHGTTKVFNEQRSHGNIDHALQIWRRLERFSIGNKSRKSDSEMASEFHFACEITDCLDHSFRC
jgi:hypothetical protein